jgi:hypothetical protein
LLTDVSGQSIGPIFKDPAVQEHDSTLCKTVYLVGFRPLISCDLLNEVVAKIALLVGWLLSDELEGIFNEAVVA